MNDEVKTDNDTIAQTIAKLAVAASKAITQLYAMSYTTGGSKLVTEFDDKLKHAAFEFAQYLAVVRQYGPEDGSDLAEYSVERASNGGLDMLSKEEALSKTLRSCGDAIAIACDTSMRRCVLSDKKIVRTRSYMRMLSLHAQMVSLLREIENDNFGATLH